MNPIINVRGTSGSGKSTLVREVIGRYRQSAAFYKEGRKRPLYSVFWDHPKGYPALAVVGHYETACGGCDTITSQDEIYEIVRELSDMGYIVLFEGLLISAEFNRAKALSDDGYNLLVVHIEIPLEECVESVNSRRREKKPDAPGVNPKNTESKWKGTRRTCERLREAHVDVVSGDREYCLKGVDNVLYSFQGDDRLQHIPCMEHRVELKRREEAAENED